MFDKISLFHDDNITVTSPVILQWALVLTRTLCVSLCLSLTLSFAVLLYSKLFIRVHRLNFRFALTEIITFESLLEITTTVQLAVRPLTKITAQKVNGKCNQNEIVLIVILSQHIIDTTCTTQCITYIYFPMKLKLQRTKKNKGKDRANGVN